MSQLTQRGGKAMESVVSPIVNLFWGPHRCRSDIKKFFGEDDPDRRQAALDSLHIALQHTTRDCLSPKQKALWKAGHELLNYARQSVCRIVSEFLH
jgi:hypothetical protein